MTEDQDHRKIEPTILVIFGATGSLSRERLIPALHHLFDHKLLPKMFSVVGFARSVFSHEQFRKLAKPSGATGKSWAQFSKKIFYQPGNFTSDADFQKLGEILHKIENRGYSCANRLFYFSTLPSHYETISRQLDKHGLLIGCTMHKRQTRVVIEKPFGFNLASARRLNKTLNQYFEERQIYRIDHYLGKETVQNLLTVRFANSIFEPIWNKNYVDHVQISALNDYGIQNRGVLFEQSGSLRDYVQNHLVQLLALIAMEQPVSLTTEAIRTERVKVIKSIRKMEKRDFKNQIVFGQYGPGRVRGQTLPGYRQEKNVSSQSNTETFVALKLFLDNSRWAGVPFYLRNGFNLSRKVTEISVHFKKQNEYLFAHERIQPNVLTFAIQPNEGIKLNFMAKYPGFGIRLHPVNMGLGYHQTFNRELPEAYERLLLDFMEGDQRLFAGSEEVEASWKFIDHLEKLKTGLRLKFPNYRAGSWGPPESIKLIEKDQRQWHVN